MMRVNSAAGSAASNRLVILERISGTWASFGFEFLLRQHTRIVLAPMCCFALKDSSAPASRAQGRTHRAVMHGADGPRGDPAVSVPTRRRAGLRLPLRCRGTIIGRPPDV